MFQTLKALAIAGAVFAGATVVQPARADHIALGVGMGVNVRATSTTIVNPSPVVYALPSAPPPVYNPGGGYGYVYGGNVVPAYSAPSYGPIYAAPAYSTFNGPSFGYEMTFYQPNFYYGGGFYQTTGISSTQPLYFGYGRNYYGGGYYGGGAVAVPSYSYRTAPAWAGPRYNGMPSRLTFGPLSRW
ncbi:MAG TPA: hypothetical protein VHM90_11095 [Phycisphaerae bacterium]|nr:hypothetical protein [Phycisphaerae bacterium]